MAYKQVLKLALSVLGIIASVAYSLTSLPTLVAVRSGDSTEAIPLFKEVSINAIRIVPEIKSQPLHGTVSIVARKSTYWKLQRPAVPAFKAIPIDWLKYKPASGFSGTDSFTYNVSDGNGSVSNTVKCIVKVRPNSNSGQTILLLSHDTLMNPLATEINRLKADMESEGYTVIIKTITFANRGSGISDTVNNANALTVWNKIREEYMVTNRVLTGVVFLGYIPPMRMGRQGIIPSDDSYWNMSINSYDWVKDSMCFHLGDSVFSANDTMTSNYGATNHPQGGSLRHVWVSRFYARDYWNSSYLNVLSKVGSEFELMKRALDNNHNYRKGISRFPHKVYAYDMYRPSAASVLNYLPTFQDTVRIANSSTSGRTVVAPGDTVFKIIDPYKAGNGGEIWDINCHGNTDRINPNNYYTWIRNDTLLSRPFQTRFAFLSACHTSYPGHFTGNHLYTRGGGNVLVIGSADYVHFNCWYSPAGNYPSAKKLNALVSAGESWGSAWNSSDMPLGHAYFYGDLSLKIKMAPSNEFPVISKITKSTPVPGRTKFTAESSDPDGSITLYEWWFSKSYNFGVGGPDTITTVAEIEVASSRVTSPVRLEVVDNYMARFYAEMSGDTYIGPVASEQEQDEIASHKESNIAAFPNPFNPIVNIKISIPELSSKNINVTIVNLKGEIVKRYSEKLRDGAGVFQWNGRSDCGKKVSSGVYLIVVRSGSFEATSSIVFTE
ncbi:MAG: T9SS type A sorting domain-containing protein [Fibrobacteres bacterium]|nr:T9SS type A sorting domain-containing protein [Fibrobacterota bacterium]